MYLPDVNVWLAMTFRAHIHHVAAKAWFDALGSEVCCFCRLTQQGFLRLATNRRAFPADAVQMDDAWRLYDTLLCDPRVGFAAEPAGIEAKWRTFTASRQFSPQVWNDAYPAAFAIAANWELVSFDQGLKVYAGLKCRILT
jgi:toxin-antitoxin system PIN domain toxin